MGTRLPEFNRYTDALSRKMLGGKMRRYKLFFLCGGEAALSFKMPEVRFFPHNELPRFSPSRVTEYQIQHMFAHAAHHEWPTTFN